MNFEIKQKLHTDENFKPLIEDDELYKFLQKLLENDLEDYSSLDINIIFIERICQLSEKDLYQKLWKKEGSLPTIFIGIQPLPSDKDYFNNIEQFNCYLFDNSIWTHYISLSKQIMDEVSGKHQLIMKDLTELKEDIREKIGFVKANVNLNVYKTINATEYNELLGRLSIVNTIGEIGGHGSQIKPLIFHSESIAKANSKELVRFIESKIKNELNLKLLLIDDYADKSLNIEKSSKEYENEDAEMLSKRFILEKRLSTFQNELEFSRLNLLSEGSLEIASTIEEGLKKIEDNSYDIVLLDFLFSSENISKDKYGTELLNNIGAQHSNKHPLKKVWILPITAYNTAFQDHMRFKRISYINKDFELSRGADFINTPYLFLYELLSIIKQQILRVDEGLFNANFGTILEQQVRDCFKTNKENKSSFYQDIIKREIAYESLMGQQSNVVLAKIITNEFIENQEKTKRLFGHLKSLAYNVDQRPFPTNEHVFIEYHKCKNLLDEIK